MGWMGWGLGEATCRRSWIKPRVVRRALKFASPSGPSISSQFSQNKRKLQPSRTHFHYPLGWKSRLDHVLDETRLGFWAPQCLAPKKYWSKTDRLCALRYVVMAACARRVGVAARVGVHLKSWCELSRLRLDWLLKYLDPEVHQWPPYVVCTHLEFGWCFLATSQRLFCRASRGN
jgi:hypothetical protein